MPELIKLPLSLLSGIRPIVLLIGFLSLGLLFPILDSGGITRIIFSIFGYCLFSLWLLWPISMIRKIRRPEIDKHVIWHFYISTGVIFVIALMLFFGFMKNESDIVIIPILMIIFTTVYFNVKYFEEKISAKSILVVFLSVYFLPIGAFYLSKRAKDAV